MESWAENEVTLSLCVCCNLSSVLCFDSQARRACILVPVIGCQILTLWIENTLE